MANAEHTVELFTIIFMVITLILSLIVTLYIYTNIQLLTINGSYCWQDIVGIIGIIYVITLWLFIVLKPKLVPRCTLILPYKFQGYHEPQ